MMTAGRDMLKTSGLRGTKSLAFTFKTRKLSSITSITSKNTASIITLAKHEHDFINAWIEYHYKIGFNHFYVLVDNITEKQKKYVIQEQFKHCVSFIYTNDADIHFYKASLQVEQEHLSGVLHELLNNKIVNTGIIKEEWVTALGIDQYFYLNGNNTIQEYLNKIEEKCTQIIFPWSFCFFNNNNSKFDNFLENCKSYKNVYGWEGHSNGLIRRCNLSKMNGNSHSFESRTPKQKVFIINEYYIMPSNLDTYYFFDIVQQKLNTLPFDKIKISSFHILLRNVNEYFIKPRLCWNCKNKNNEEENNSYFYNLSLNIKNNTNIEKVNGRHGVNETRNVLLEKQIQLKFPKLAITNGSEHYDTLILNKLSHYGIQKEEFEVWKKNFFT
jgi:hypothetical protein